MGEMIGADDIDESGNLRFRPKVEGMSDEESDSSSSE